MLKQSGNLCIGRRLSIAQNQKSKDVQIEIQGKVIFDINGIVMTE